MLKYVGFFLLLSLTPVYLFAQTAGFVGDGVTDNTTAIQAAIDSCSNAGGGVVEFAKGIFLTGPITLESNVTLRIDSSATLLGSSNMKAYYPVGYDTSYPVPSKLQPLITSNRADSLTITGGGTIDGNGQEWWTAYENGTISTRPRLIQLSHSQYISIENVTLQNSPQFHVSLQYCWYVNIRNVNIFAPPSSPNTDGIDPATSHFVYITGCHINTGDDNIAIKSGNYDSSNPNAGSSNIFIWNNTLIHGHGISIGSETNGGVDSMFVWDCTFDSTDNGLRIKSYRGAGGNVRHVSYRNITMNHVKHPIWFTEYYPNIPSQSDPAQKITAVTPYFHDVTIDSLVSDSGGTSYPGSAIVGLPETPMRDIVLKNVNIGGKYGVEVRNASVYTSNTSVSVTSGSQIIYEIRGSFSPAIFTNGTGGGNWDSPSTWEGGAVPDSTKYAVILCGDSVTVGAGQSTKCGSLAIFADAVLNDAAPLSVPDTLTIGDTASYYNACPGSPSFPRASVYGISNLSNYIHTASADSILGGPGYDSTFGNLTIEQDTTVASSNLIVNGNLNLVGDKLFIGHNNIIAADVNGGSSTSYVVTDSGGALRIPGVGATQTIFPVGTSLGYSPVWIASSTSPDTFTVSAETDTDLLVENSGRVNTKWNISKSTPGSVSCTLKFGWVAEAEDAGFAADRSGDAKIFNINDSIATAEAGTGSYTTQLTSEPYTVSRGGITALGSFGVGNFTVTSVEGHGATNPTSFGLYQNYPNPFNPSTVIDYQVASSARVTLRVFDVLGREVESLVDQRETPGNYSVSFDGSRLPSGVYFYRLTAGSFSAVRKMIIIR